MKIIIIALFLVVSSADLFGQRYKTMGIAQYQKDLNGKYTLINKVLDYGHLTQITPTIVIKIGKIVETIRY